MVNAEILGVEPFKIDIDRKKVESIKQLIELTDLESYYAHLGTAYEADEKSLNDYDFSNIYGIKPANIKALVDRLQSGFDWYAWQDKLNALGEQGLVTLKGVEDKELKVHYLHIKSKKANAPAVCLIHGWPGSFIEFYKMGQDLSKDYNVVMPSLMGYTFSSPPNDGKTFSLVKQAACMDAVMRALKYNKYAAQGGDWSCMIVPTMARVFSQRCVAFHVNANPIVREEDLSKLTPKEREGQEKGGLFMKVGLAYDNMHRTVPFTAGAILSASPIATIAYIGEKFFRWSAEDTQPSLDEILVNCLLYWFTGSTTSSMWLYYACYEKKIDWAEFVQGCDTLGAFGGGPHDLMWATKGQFESQYPNGVSWDFLARGGHFAALEVPDLLAASFRQFLESDRVKKALA